jgi:hypothetical protein
MLSMPLHALPLQNTAGAAYGGSGDPYGSGGAGVVDSQGGGMGEHISCICGLLAGLVDAVEVAFHVQVLSSGLM